MKINGVLIRFDCTDNQQYDNIGKFWDFMSQLYPKEELKGVGYNWANDSFDYVIGADEGKYDFSLDCIRKEYPNSKNVVLELPDRGWKVYTCKIEKLSELYDNIYKDGVLDYEIEEFDNDGECKISILRL